MALIANVFSHTTFDPGPQPDDMTEGLGATSIETGHYKNPTRPDEKILIYRIKTVLNANGTEIRRDDERFQYDVPGGPPLRYDHEIWAKTYLPGIGRGFRKVQEETHYFWCFSPRTSKDNLGKTRVVNAYVVYDIPEDPTVGLTGDALQKVIDDGYQAGTFQDRIIATGKLWSEANRTSAVVEEESAAQGTKWINGVIVEHDEIEEEFDKWTKWTTEKDALRAGGVEVAGPEFIKKEGYRYQLPVPLNPPKLEAGTGGNGVFLEARGGGAEINNSYFGPSGRWNVAPEKYYFYRKTVSEPARTPDDNLYDLWDTPPAAPTSRLILTDTDVTDLDGVPASPLPVAGSWTEPQDPDPEDPPRDTEFRRVAEVENTMGLTDEGYASFEDTDCEATAEYEYYATAVYGTQESSDSNHETVTFAGNRNRKYRIVDKDDVVDAIAPDDPIYPDEDFGEVVEFDLPAEDVVEVAEEAADRQFAMNRAADFTIRATVIHPMLGLEWGQKVRLPNVEWSTYANALHLTTETDNDVWMVTGFKKAIRRTKDGEWESPNTVLTLQERPRPQ
jgi:hypothetical protein